MDENRSPSQLHPVLPVACEQCRRGKRKCDRVAPRCGYCTKTGRECTMPDVLEQSHRPKRQRMPKGFVEILEARVQQLEASIESHLTELQIHKYNDDPSVQTPKQNTAIEGAFPNGSSGEASATSSTGRDEHADSALDMRASTPASSASMPASLSEDREVYPLSAESIVSLSTMSESNEFGLFNSTSVAHAMLALDGRSPFGSSMSRSNIFQDSPHTPEGLELSKMLQTFLLKEGESLLSRYERDFHARFPFVEIKELRKLMQYYKTQGNIEHGQRASSARRFQLFIVLAIGLAIDGRRFSFARQIEGQVFLAALSHLASVFGSSPDIDQVRILLLLAFYSMLRSSAGSTWHLIGFSMRICIARGYHIGQQPDNVYKAFWSAFMLEQMVCNVLERSPSLGHVDLLAQPCSSSSTPSCNVHEEAWSYRVIRSRLLAKLDLGPGSHHSSMQDFYTIHQLKTRQPQPQSDNMSHETVAIQKELDEAYLVDLVALLSQSTETSSLYFDQFCLFVSSLLIHRLALSTTDDGIFYSWPTAILLFRASMICLRSSRITVKCNDKVELDALISNVLAKGSEYLSELCGEFQGLAVYRSVFDVALGLRHGIIMANYKPEWHVHLEPPCVASLPTILDQELSKQAFEAIQAHCPEENAFDSGIHHGLQRLVSCVCYESDEERQMYNTIFNTAT